MKKKTNKQINATFHTITFNIKAASFSSAENMNDNESGGANSSISEEPEASGGDTNANGGGLMQRVKGWFGSVRVVTNLDLPFSIFFKFYFT